MEVLLDFLLSILTRLAQFSNWLITPLDYINLSPLALLSVAGITTIVAIHLVRLFIGG